MHVASAAYTMVCLRQLGRGRLSRRRWMAAFLSRPLLAFAVLLSVASSASAGDSLEAGILGVERQLETAKRQMKRAHEVVEPARTAVTATKSELDDFVAQHFRELGSQATDLLPQPQKPSVSSTAVEEAEKLRGQIEEFVAKRDQLLERFTEVHPEVAETEAHLAELSRRLTSLRAGARGAEDLPSGPAADPSNAADRGPIARSGVEKRRHRTAAEQYRQHIERWQAAQQDLHAALEAEEQAAARLAAIKLPSTTASVAPVPHSKPAAAAPIAAPTTTRKVAAPDNHQQRSQSLALAALLIALAVAALAAVKLARSTGDTFFASVDDVAAALALPVVGVIPAVDRRAEIRAVRARVVRRSVFAAEILLAVAVFALVAYCVQNLSSAWQLCTHPLESLSRVTRLFSGD